jgi:hypothetical protein
VLAELFRIWANKDTLSNPTHAHRLPTPLYHLQQYTRHGLRNPKITHRNAKALQAAHLRYSSPNDKQCKQTLQTTDNQKIPWRRLEAYMNKSSLPWSFPLAIMNMVRRYKWHRTHQWTLSRHLTDCYKHVFEVWASWLHPSQNHELWRGSPTMELDVAQPGDHTPHGPTHSKGMNTWPAFLLWPKRRAAVIWILAHLVSYRLQTKRRLFLRDYMDFMKRSKSKLYQQTDTSPYTQRYLEVLDWRRYWGYLPDMATLTRSDLDSHALTPPPPLHKEDRRHHGIFIN